MNLYQIRLKTDFKFFVDEMLYIPHSDRKKFIITKQHLKCIQAIQDNNFTVIQAFRGFGKTELVSFCYVLWRAIMWHESSIIFSANETLAYKKMDLIRTALEFENEKLKKYCSKGIDGYVWNRGELWLIDKDSPIIDENNKEVYKIIAKIYGFSLNATARGIHCENIIGDDIVVEENSINDEMIEDTKNKWKAAIIPVRKLNSKIIVVGTPQTDNDLLADLSENNKWKSIKIPVMYNNGEPTVPELYPKEWITEQKTLQGEILFNQEYLLKPSSEKHSTIKIEYLFKARDDTISFINSYSRKENDFVLIGIDTSIIDNPNIAEKKDSDYFAIIANKLDLNTKKRQILNILISRGITIEEQIDIIINWYHLFDANGIAIETHGPLDYVRQIINSKAPHIPIYDTSNRKGKFDKYTGIPALKYIFEKDEPLYVLPYRDEHTRIMIDMLIKQLNQLAKSKHDDIADALLRTEVIFDQITKDIFYNPTFSLYDKKTRNNFSKRNLDFYLF